MKQKSINDIIESTIDITILDVLLKDRTTGYNIIWATDDYKNKGEGYAFTDTIEIDLITGENEGLIKPRVEKNKKEQTQRSKDKAEVFTPAWVVNAQNNMVDKAYLGLSFNLERFSPEKGHTWKFNEIITFPRRNGIDWTDYVSANRLEITCGEAPYLTTRYDASTGKHIRVNHRVGLLDRKLRIISQNTDAWQTWIKYAKIALQSTYGFEWQGDNLLLARENVLYTVSEHYYDKFGRTLPNKTLIEYAEIISWNLWQMDGIRFVIPETCHETEDNQISFIIDDGPVKTNPCPGCIENDKFKHNGVYCNIMDWERKKVERFVDLMKGEGKNECI